MPLWLLLLAVRRVPCVAPRPTPKQQVGPVAGGGFLLNSGWKLQPAGRQVPLDTLPMSSALSKDGKYPAGAERRLQPALDHRSAAPTRCRRSSRTPVADGWLGLTFSPDGKCVYVGGGSRARVFEFAFADGKLTPARTFAIVPEEKRTPQDFIGDVAALSRRTHDLRGRACITTRSHVINPQSGRVIEQFATGRRPYRILFHPDGKSYFVSSWADGSVYHHKRGNWRAPRCRSLGQHTTDMIWRARKPDEKSEEHRKLGRALVRLGRAIPTVSMSWA